MKRLLAAIGLVGALLLPALAAPPPVGAITCNSAGFVVWHSGYNGTGHYLYTCASEYPSSFDACSFDQPSCTFEDGSSPDNRILSVDFLSAKAGTCVEVYEGYYFSSTHETICKATSPGGVFNMGKTFSNTISSLLSLGTDGVDGDPY